MPSEFGIDPSHCGTIEVTGSAAVGGTLDVTGSSGVYTAGTRYTFLTATGGVTERFSNVIDDIPLFDILLSYDPTDIYFTLVSPRNYVDDARTFNQHGVASYLDSKKATASGDFAIVLDGINTLTGDDARNAFNALSGDIYGSLLTVSIENNERFLRTITNRMRMESMFRDGGLTMADTDRDGSLAYDNREWTSFDALRDRLSGWTTCFDSYGVGASIGGNGNASGLGYSTGGMAIGMERYLDDHTLFGFGGGYASSRTNLNDASDWGSIDGGQFAAYLRRDLNDNYLTGIVAYGYNSYAAKRYIDFAAIDRTATSNYNGNNYSSYLEVGRNLFGRNVNWQPFAALEYIGVQQNAFAEQNANSIDLHVTSPDAYAFRGLVGARLVNYYRTRAGRLLTLDASVAWRHEFLDENRIFDASFVGQTGGAFAACGVNVDRDAGIVGTGLHYALSNNCSIYASYDLVSSNDYTAHAGLGGFQYAW